MYGVVRLRQAVVIGNAKASAGSDVPDDEISKGARQFELAVSRSTAASSDANIVCGYLLYNIVTFGTDVCVLARDPNQVQIALTFLLVNVIACALALVSVLWGLFINVWSSVSDSSVFRFFFILRAKTVTKLAYYLFLLALNLMIVTMALFGKTKYPTPNDPSNMPTTVTNPARLSPDDTTIDYNTLYRPFPFHFHNRIPVSLLPAGTSAKWLASSHPSAAACLVSSSSTVALCTSAGPTEAQRETLFRLKLRASSKCWGR